MLNRRVTERWSLFKSRFEKTRWLVELPTSTPTDSISISFISIVKKWFRVQGSGFKKREPQNIECRILNVEGWYRCRSIILIKTDRIPSFEIRYSSFDIRYSLFTFLFRTPLWLFPSNYRLHLRPGLAVPVCGVLLLHQGASLWGLEFHPAGAICPAALSGNISLPRRKGCQSRPRSCRSGIHRRGR